MEMSTSQRVRSLGIHPIDVLAAFVLSAVIAALAGGVVDTGFPSGSVFAACMAVLITMPVLWARRAPLAAASTLTAASAFNGLLFGSLVRCGASVPATFWVACAVGLRCRGPRSVAGLCICLVGLGVQSLSDPNLAWPTPVATVPLTVGFWLAGWGLRSRADVIARLAKRNGELAAARSRTARLAVEADRARIAHGLDARLFERLGGLAERARAARPLVIAEPDSARAAFAAIAVDGRRILVGMREVVDSLGTASQTRPQPRLGDLAGLVAEQSGSTLSIVGEPGPLPDGIELSAYRIVELVLRAAAPGPGRPARVVVGYERVKLALTVRCAPIGAGDPAVRAALEQRIALHGGVLERHARGEWRAALPLGVARV